MVTMTVKLPFFHCYLNGERWSIRSEIHDGGTPVM